METETETKDKQMNINFEVRANTDSTYPTSHVRYEESYYDEDGFPVIEPVIYLDKSQIEGFAEKFNISRDEAGDICLSHEQGHCIAYYKGMDFRDENLAWELAPNKDIDIAKFEEIKNFCLGSYNNG